MLIGHDVRDEQAVEQTIPFGQMLAGWPTLAGILLPPNSGSRALQHQVHHVLEADAVFDQLAPMLG